MQLLLKNFGILIIGIIIGMLVNMGLIVIGGIIFPIEQNFEPMNAISWDFKYFIFPLLAHSIGTLSGVFIATKLLKNYQIIISSIIGLFFFSGGIYMVLILPAPNWFICLDLIVCYMPMAFLGWKISK